MAERNLRDAVKVGSLGKIKTAIQMISISLLLLANPTAISKERSVIDILGWNSDHKAMLLGAGMFTLMLCTVLTVVSGVQYFTAAVSVLKLQNLAVDENLSN
jgi:phosphatidylglycerophosphate synthase